MKRGKHQIKSHMTMEYNFSGIRLQDGMLTPVDWNMQVDLIATGKKGKTEEDVEQDAGIIYQKIYFWLEANLQGIVVVSTKNSEDLYIANLSSNIMMYCPDNPSDDMLIQLLHAKLTSLSTEDLVIGEIQLKGSDTSIRYTYDCLDGNYGLPTLVSEYFTDGPTQDDAPWWMRDDGFCFEFLKPDELDLTDEEKAVLAERVDPMDEFYRVVAELKNSAAIGVMREPAKIVKVEKWNPKKV